jgi:uncharacterized protein involved in exopolysaccharide biosynthesis
VWASSGERPVYSATLVLQVNDTQAQSDGPVTNPSMSLLRAQRAEFPRRESELVALAARTRIDLEAYQFILSQLYEAQIGGADPAYVEIVDPASGAAAIPARGAIGIVLAALLGLVLGLGAVFAFPLLNRAAVAADRRWLEKPF